MRITVDDKALKAMVSRVIKHAPQAVEDVKEAIAVDTHKYAREGILRGPASGRIYEKYKPRRTHKASGPGEYPMSDTGHLANNVKLDRSGSAYYVGTAIRYGRYLEFGTTNMLPRPWLGRSFNRAVIGVDKELKERFERGL